MFLLNKDLKNVGKVMKFEFIVVSVEVEGFFLGFKVRISKDLGEVGEVGI